MTPFLDHFAGGAFAIALAAFGISAISLMALRTKISLRTRGRILLGSLFALMLVPPAFLSLPPIRAEAVNAPGSIENTKAEATVASPIPTAEPATFTSVTSDIVVSPWGSRIRIIWLAGTLLATVITLIQIVQLSAHLRRLRPVGSGARRRIAESWPAKSRLDPDRVQLLFDHGLSGPYAFFGFRPHLVFPSGWEERTDSGTLATVIAHELGHLEKRDTWTLLGWRIAVAIYWWNPLVWILYRSAARCMEYRADDAATRSFPERVAFARTLLAEAEKREGASLPVGATGTISGDAICFRRRVERLVEPEPIHPTRRRVLITSSLLALACVAWTTGCASLRQPVGADGETAFASCIRTMERSKELVARLEKAAAKVGGKLPGKQVVAVEVRIFASGRSARGDAFPEGVSVLNPEQLEATVKEYQSRRKVHLVNYPRVQCFQATPAVIHSVVNQPILVSSSSDAAGNTTATVGYVPVGTTIGVVPTLLKNGNIHLDLELAFSEIIGSADKEGNPYPVISLQESVTAVEIERGYSISIGFPQPERGTSGATCALITVGPVDK